MSTTLEDLKPVPVELGGVRGGPDVRTLRRDRWWRNPAATVVVLTVIVVYATWAVFQNAYYYVGAAAHRDLISPLYSPCVAGSCVPGAHGTFFVINWWHLSPGCWPWLFRGLPPHLLLLPQGLLPGLLAEPRRVRRGRRPPPVLG